MNNKLIEKIELQLAEANNLLLELKKENETLKQENLDLKNKIILLEKMIQDLKESTPKKATKKVSNNEKTLKQDIELLKMFTMKKSYRPCLQYIMYNENTLVSTDIDTRVIIEKNIPELEQGFFEPDMLKNGITNKIVGIELDDYPLHKIDKFEENLKINSKVLFDELSKVVFCASSQTDNIALSVVRFDLLDGILTLACSDSYRLIKTSIPCEYTSAHGLSIQLPLIKALLKDLKGLDTEIIINYNLQNNQIFIEYLNRKIYSRAIDLSFPNYKGIFEAKNTDKTVLIDKKIFVEKLEKLLLVAIKNNENKGACSFYFENNNIKMVSTDNINNVVTENIDIKLEFELKINLNIKFILDHIKTFEGEKVKLEFSYNKPNSSAVYINDNFVVMPLAWREV